MPDLFLKMINDFRRESGQEEIIRKFTMYGMRDCGLDGFVLVRASVQRCSKLYNALISAGFEQHTLNLKLIAEFSER